MSFELILPFLRPIEPLLLDDSISEIMGNPERAVEEYLFNKVVGRFQAEVKTLSLKGVSVSDDDYKTVFFAMKKASEYSGHDRPAGRQPTVRTIDEMRADLEELRKFVKDVNARRTALEAARSALETAPKAITT
jgi:hypothetical protein